MSVTAKVSSAMTVIANAVKVKADITHQGGSRTAQTIFVQLTGEPDPGSPATGDIRVKQV